MRYRAVPLFRWLARAAVAGLVLGVLLSCATVSPGESVEVVTGERGAAGISPENRMLLERARLAVAAAGPGGEGVESPGNDEWEMFFSFSAWPRGREILKELLADRYGSDGSAGHLERGLSRVNAGYVAATASREVGWVSTDISRFAGSIVLNSAGWKRTGWGVWTDPETGFTVRFLPDRIWEVRRRPYTGVASGYTGGYGVLPRYLLTDLLYPPPLSYADEPSVEESPVGVVARIYRPSIPGVPAAILPEIVELLVRSDDKGSLRFEFSDERAARIALVPFRLQGRRIIEAYGFFGTEDFDIIRFDATVVISGITLERFVLPE
jgi:hypothetical protein